MKKTILISLLFSLIFLGLNQIFFWGDWFLLFFALTPGFVIVFYQKQEKAYQFLLTLIIGSLIYGFLSIAMTELLHFSMAKIPYNWPVVLQMTLIYSFVSFLGGLVAIVIKGFFVLYKNKIDRDKIKV